MLTRRTTLPIFAVATLAALTPAAPAQACSGADCRTPGRFVLPENGEVPTSFGELTVFVAPELDTKAFPRAGDFEIKLRPADDPSRVAFAGEIKARNGSFLGLGTALEQGKSYIVEATPVCASSPTDQAALPTTTATIKVGAASTPPTTLGPLKLVQTGTTTVPIGGGAGCWEDYPANAADVELDPASVPEPWRSLLTHYQLMVDGEPFDWQMTIGAWGPTDSPRAFYFAKPKLFRAWTLCGDPNQAGLVGSVLPRGVSSGRHTLWVRARVPSHPATVIESEKIEISLQCPVRADYGGGHGTDAGAGAQADAAASDAEIVDATLADTDAGATKSLAPVGDWGDDVGPADGDEGGCNLGTSQRRSAGALEAALLGLLLACNARTYRRSRRVAARAPRSAS